MTDKAFADYFVNRVIEALAKSDKCPECKASFEKYKCSECRKSNICGDCVKIKNRSGGYLCKDCYININ